MLRSTGWRGAHTLKCRTRAGGRALHEGDPHEISRAVATMSPADAATGGEVSKEVETCTSKVRELQSALLSDLAGGNRFECFRAPATLADAYTDAQAFQAALADDPDGKKKRRMMEEEAERMKKWAMPPGESLIDENHAPFLAYNEEYFRHITAEDVASIVPEGPIKLQDDPDFRVPALGRYYVLGESAASSPSPFHFRSLFSTGSVLASSQLAVRSPEPL